VAQTAVLLPAPAALDCTAPSSPVTLPSEPQFGGGVELSDTILAKGKYGAGQGPGVSLAALDGFRLFVNGELLAEGTASLEPAFVPLTLLPGDNAIAVVVTARDRAPVLLAEVAELERLYVSDATWKVSSDPGSAFSEPSTDDSQWPAASDRGSIEQSPACDPGDGFPAGSDAHFIAAEAPGTAVFRLDVPIAPIGFAAGTTGGGSLTPVTASTPEDIVSALKSDDPKVVVVPEGSLDVRRTGSDVTNTAACPTSCGDGTGMLTYNLLPDDQTCPIDTVPETRNERRIKIGSNTTLVGLGRGAALLGGSLDIAGSENVIVRNFVLYGVNQQLIEAGDGVSIDDGADGVWIDHATFWQVSDGFIDSTSRAQNLTFSWVRNEGDNLAACQGQHPRSNQLTNTTATIHHSLWERVNGRAPAVTQSASQVHLFNNVVSNDLGYAVGAACGARVLVEGSVFENVSIWTDKFGDDCDDPNDSKLGFIRAAGRDNLYLGSGKHESDGVEAPEPADSAVPDPTYAYTLDPAESVRFVVPEWAGAGARWALPLNALPAP
jgi:pectate lyase